MTMTNHTDKENNLFLVQTNAKPCNPKVDTVYLVTREHFEHFEKFFRANV